MASANKHTATMKIGRPGVWGGVNEGFLVGVGSGCRPRARPLSTALSGVAGDSVTCRSLKTTVLKSERVASETWKRALIETISKNHQWVQQDQRLKRVAKTGPFEGTG